MIGSSYPACMPYLHSDSLTTSIHDTILQILRNSHPSGPQSLATNLTLNTFHSSHFLSIPLCLHSGIHLIMYLLQSFCGAGASQWDRMTWMRRAFSLQSQLEEETSSWGRGGWGEYRTHSDIHTVHFLYLWGPFTFSTPNLSLWTWNNPDKGFVWGQVMFDWLLICAKSKK